MRKFLLAAACAAVIITPACAKTESVDTAKREEIEQIVHDYILENPEIIEEALIKLSEKQRLEAESGQRAKIAANAGDLYAHPDDPFIGPADAEVTLVEFFDYRCGYCKRSVNWVQGLPEAYDNKVKVVFKEYPIFGGVSETAALATLAAHKQGKYFELHLALMNLKSNDDLTQASIDRLASEAGLDVVQLRIDMKSDEVKDQLAEMQDLGRTLGVDGTPGFFIGETYVAGADTPRIERILKDMVADS